MKQFNFKILFFFPLILTIITCTMNIEARKNPKQGRTKAILTVNSFEKGGDGDGAAECDGHFHSNQEKIVALSTGPNFFNNGHRCGKKIKIFAKNGREVEATVVDECDVTKDHCKKNVVDASEAVWSALGVNKGTSNFGEMEVTWSDA